MLRRLSTTFKKDKKKDNGVSSGSPSPKDSSNGSPTSDNDHGKGREEVSNTFAQFAQVLHASQRPLPLQTGDGTYVKRETPASLFENLKAIGIADVKTLKDVLANKAKRELIDDKTYLMERVIQVICFLRCARWR